MVTDMPFKPRYIMIGGFLGAGKTTVMAQLGRWLREAGLRPGLITNDQSVGLVDTASLRSQGFDVREIPGGCFCCRFGTLVEAADELNESSRPDVFLAEPVGSCTDLVASVSYPLRRIYGDQFTIAPLSVVVDPIRAGRILGLRPGKTFSEKVAYVYRKQLEEASFIVINKIDLVSEEELDQLSLALEEQYPDAQVLACSARQGKGLDAWFVRLMREEWQETGTMEVDYELYAEGEAMLGWMNATLKLQAAEPFDGEVVMMDLADVIQKRLGEVNAEIAHMKMTISPRTHEGAIGVLSLVRNDFVPELSNSLMEKMREGELVVNVRAEADPEIIVRSLNEGLTHCRAKHGQLQISMEHQEHFRPAKPQPTHRMRG